MNYPTNKTNVYNIDDIWCLHISYLKKFGPENIRGYRYVLLVIDNSSNLGWTVPLKIKNAQTIKELSKIFLLVQNDLLIFLNLIEERKFITVFFKSS